MSTDSFPDQISCTSIDRGQDAVAIGKHPLTNYGRAEAKLQSEDNESPAIHGGSPSQSNRTELSASKHSSSPPNLDKSRFSHQPLQLDTPSIRLIKVETPMPDGTIRCTIRHATLKSPSGFSNADRHPLAGTFTCLSYVWGPSEPTQEILVNERRFRVRDNLWRFLSAVSLMRARDYASIPRTVGVEDWILYMGPSSWGPWYQSLWIDALCIDQENDRERNHQVQQMGRMYSSATRIVVWLGNSPSLVGLIKVFENNGMPSTDSTASLLGGDGYPGIEELYENTYWQRAWVIQEVVLAHEVWFQAQDAMISVFELMIATSYMDYTRAQALMNLADRVSLETPVASHHTTARRSTLIENIARFRRKGCSDARDRVFSLLSISRDGGRYTVDYGSSTLELARSVLKLGDNEICLYNTLTIIEALELERTSSRQDLCSTFLSSLRLPTEDISPCTYCYEGDEDDQIPPEIEVHSTSNVRFFCLACGHLDTETRLKRHSKRASAHHMGHLCLVRHGSDKVRCRDTALYWKAHHGNSWQKLESFHEVIIDKKGAFCSLAVSLGVICELIPLLQLEEASRNYVDREAKSAWASVDPMEPQNLDNEEIVNGIMEEVNEASQ